MNDFESAAILYYCIQALSKRLKYNRDVPKKLQGVSTGGEKFVGKFSKIYIYSKEKTH